MRTLSTLLVMIACGGSPAAETISFFGYDDCIQLANDRSRVVLCPAAGGRVLVYAFPRGDAVDLEAVVNAARGTD